jgi:hypothetical protein
MLEHRAYLDHLQDVQWKLVKTYINKKYPVIDEEIKVLMNVFFDMVDQVHNLEDKIKNLDFLITFNEETQPEAKDRLLHLKAEQQKYIDSRNALINNLDDFITNGVK